MRKNMHADNAETVLLTLSPNQSGAHSSLNTLPRSTNFRGNDTLMNQEITVLKCQTSQLQNEQIFFVNCFIVAIVVYFVVIKQQLKIDVYLFFFLVEMS